MAAFGGSPGDGLALRPVARNEKEGVLPEQGQDGADEPFHSLALHQPAVGKQKLPLCQWYAEPARKLLAKLGARPV